MTVATTTNKAIATGNGVTTVFPFAFGTLPTPDLVVTLFDLLGVEIPQTEITDYTVQGAGDEDGGSVTFVVAPPDEYTVLIQRIVPETQPTDIKNQGSFYPRTIERMFDRIVYIIQQLSERIASALTLPPQISGVSTVLPTPESLRLIGWNNDADALKNFSVDEIGTTLAFSNFIADTFTASAGQTVYPLSASPGIIANLDVSIDGVTQVPGLDYTLAANDLTMLVAAAGGERVLARYGTALATGITEASAVNYSDPVAPAFLKTLSDMHNGERVSILRNIPQAEWAGIRAGSSTYRCDDRIQDLLTAMDSLGYGELYFPGGVFLFEDRITIPSNVTLRGVSGRTWLKPNSAVYKRTSDGVFFVGTGKSNVVFDGIGFDGDYVNQTQAFRPGSNLFTNATSIVFDRCHFKDNKGICAAFAGDTKYSGLRNSKFTNNGRYNLISGDSNDRKDAVWFGGGVTANCVLNFLESNSIVDTGLSACASTSQTGFSILNNRIQVTGGGGVYMSVNNGAHVANNTVLSAGGNGIDSYGSYSVNYTGNTIIGSTAAGIMLASPIDTAPDVVTGAIVGNTLTGNNTNAASTHKGQITLHNGTANKMANVIVEGNVCTGGAGYGFYVVPLGATSTTSRVMGDNIRIGSGNVFAGNALGDMISRDQAYPGSGKQFYDMAAGATMVLMPAVGGGTVNPALIEVMRMNDSRYGLMLARGTGAVTELMDPSTVFEPTDTGTETAIYYDAGSGNILMKNRTALTRTFAVSIRSMGQAVG